MSTTVSDPNLTTTGQLREPNDVIWHEGEVVQPLRIKQGVVVYRLGEATLGLAGPGEVLLPLPGFAKGGRAVAAAIAVTDTAVTEIQDPEKEITAAELEASVRSLVQATDRLGNLTIPARLAALLLEISERQGHPVIHCRQDILAMAVGSRRETVAVILSQWRDYDWIQTRYRRVKVVHRDALRQIAIGGTPPPGVVSF